MGKRGIGTEALCIDIKIDAFGQNAVATHFRGIGDTAKVAGGLVGNDVNDTSDGIRAIERRGCPVQHLDTLHASHIHSVQVDIAGDVAREFLTVYQDKDILIAQSVQTQETAH